MHSVVTSSVATPSFELGMLKHFVVDVKVEPDQVMDLIQASHFLGIKSLLNVAATMVAHHLAGNMRREISDSLVSHAC